MTSKEIFKRIRTYGIWRCRIEEAGFFEVNIYIPKTSMNKKQDILFNCLPVGIKVNIKEMKKPLKLKKYTYIDACFI